MGQIYVVGSMSMDLVVSTESVPAQGETVLGDDFFTTPGGKGANQAVAAARLGDGVHMIGCVGTDAWGEQIRQNLEMNHVNVEGIQVIEGIPSGTAHIILSEQDNRIIVVPSANQYLTPDRVQPQLDRMSEGDIVLIQQEIPTETVICVIDYCAKHGIVSILNPAPYRAIPESVITQVDYLTPNETEHACLFEGQALETTLAHYPNQLIVTLGSSGAVYHNGEQMIQVPSVKSVVKDTTGAGDTFNGALAVGLQKGYPLKKVIEFANLAASYSVTGMGAQGGMPVIEDLAQTFDV
ncbi:ribokinase [Staphylococcus lutrae]|uniref:Ribokinase n=1 Tax=Staphylococcus lutrae TaxID=155085 RepID=A0AAC9RNF4_9STAP|nr:ribokinase [Staphylococcus lutrae]ARJ50738.1 ribokinase [Staphylococcus lutrae]PNZ37871.1 ribokinase [Staphylococcus lutrae]